MITSIKILHDDARDCIEDIIVTIASWLNRNYEIMYLDMWNFDFIENGDNNTIGNRIIISDGKPYKLLEQYHGIKIQGYHTKNATDVLFIAKKEFGKGYPLAIYLDAFWNPWDTKGYQKGHFPHYILTVGFNNKGLYCIDPFFKKDNIFLPMEDFIQGCGPCFTFSIVGKDNQKLNWKEKLVKIIKKLNGEEDVNNAFIAMKNFGKELSTLSDLSNELQNYDDYWRSPLFLNVEKISRTRRKFAKVLQYIAKYYNVEGLIKISNELEQLGMDWKIIYYLLYKASLLSDQKMLLNWIAHKIEKNADKEKEISFNLYKICSKL